MGVSPSGKQKFFYRHSLGVENQRPEGDVGSGAWGLAVGLAGILALALAASYQSVSVIRAAGARMPDGSAARPADIPPVEPGDPILSAAHVESAGPSAAGIPDAAPEPGEAGRSEADRPAGSSETPARPDTAPATSDSPETLTAAALKDEYPLQDNPLSGCSLCHVDVEDELIGSLHFDEKVGCITCHGPSQGHLADENNEVKPDQVFARADVNRLCQRCHECSRPKPEKPELTADGRRKVCIDCHGAHDVVLAADAGAPASP